MRTVSKPLSREDMIKVAKLGKGKTSPWEDKHFAEVEPKKIEGFHVFNESDATVHIVRVNDVYIIYVEPQLAVNELTDP
jgi:hypothetical protein